MSEPVVSIIVVSYNTRQMTLDCLASVREQTTVPHEVIVLDNASTDGSAEAIAQAFPQYRLIAETDNHGFAKGNNIAARHASGEFILLLNPDTVVLDQAIDQLVAFARARPEAKIWGGTTFFADLSLNTGNCWQRMTLWNTFCRTSGLAAAFKTSPLFNAEAYGGWARDSVRAVDIVSGCYLMLPRTLWETLGGFDLTYVMYGEEADLCLRATRRHGANPHVTPASRIIHYGGASERVRADKMVRLLKAKTTLIRRHLPAGEKAAALFLFRAWPWARAVLLSAAARVKPGLKDSAASWREVWKRRAEWWQGYRDA